LFLFFFLLKFEKFFFFFFPKRKHTILTKRMKKWKLRKKKWCKFNFIWSHIYLWNKVVCFVLFVTQRSPKAKHFMPQSWYLQKALSMSKGAPTWFKAVWSYNVEAIWSWNHFLNEIFKKLKLKTVLEFEGILSVVGKPSTTQI